MQWILQRFEDTTKLAAALDELAIPYTWHKVIPFIGELQPEPSIVDPSKVVFFGSYSLWRYAERMGLTPGVFTIRPFVHEKPWQPFMLNGPDARFLTVAQMEVHLEDDGRDWFIRPVSDAKEQPGMVRTTGEIRETAAKVMSLEPEEIPGGCLRPDTEMMLTPPVRIEKEWRLWVVGDEVVTWSLYKDGRHVVYRPEIEESALHLARDLVAANPSYAPAYVMDICRTGDGLRLLETNCLNAAGFYAADLKKLVRAIDAIA